MFHYQAHTDLKHYLAICQIPQIGSSKLARLFAHFDSMDAIFGTDVATLVALGFSQTLASAILNPQYEALEADLAWEQQSPQHHMITLLDAQYPEQLKQIAAKPPILYACGHIDLLKTPQIAIVGSRNPSTYGLMNTQVLSSQLSQQGFTITSGLALGVDAKAHQAALNAKGATIAVLGAGLLQIYPKRHEKLSVQIQENGLLLSEFPVNTLARAENFPRRNRIISGLSVGVLVVEAALKSGSLITARYAMEQNREVFAIPGAIQNPLAHGCHALIRQGAKLVETVTDIIEEFSGLNRLPAAYPAIQAVAIPSLAPKEQQVLHLISHSPTPFDFLVEQTNLSVQELTAALTQLEVLGLVRATSYGYQLEQTYETQCA